MVAWTLKSFQSSDLAGFVQSIDDKDVLINSLVVKYFAKLSGLLDPHLDEDIAICVILCKIAWILKSQEKKKKNLEAHIQTDISKNVEWEGCKQAELQGQMDSLAASIFAKNPRNI